MGPHILEDLTHKMVPVNPPIKEVKLVPGIYISRKWLFFRGTYFSFRDSTCPCLMPWVQVDEGEKDAERRQRVHIEGKGMLYGFLMLFLVVFSAKSQLLWIRFDNFKQIRKRNAITSAFELHGIYQNIFVLQTTSAYETCSGYSSSLVVYILNYAPSRQDIR